MKMKTQHVTFEKYVRDSHYDFGGTVLSPNWAALKANLPRGTWTFGNPGPTPLDGTPGFRTVRHDGTSAAVAELEAAFADAPWVAFKARPGTEGTVRDLLEKLERSRNLAAGVVSRVQEFSESLVMNQDGSITIGEGDLEVLRKIVGVLQS
jgi:hypothetical protein